MSYAAWWCSQGSTRRLYVHWGQVKPWGQEHGEEVTLPNEVVALSRINFVQCKPSCHAPHAQNNPFSLVSVWHCVYMYLTFMRWNKISNIFRVKRLYGEVENTDHHIFPLDLQQSLFLHQKNAATIVLNDNCEQIWAPRNVPGVVEFAFDPHPVRRIIIIAGARRKTDYYQRSPSRLYMPGVTRSVITNFRLFSVFKTTKPSHSENL